MASVKKFKGCKYWYACYRRPDGKREQKSTHMTSKSEALKHAEKLESVWRKQLTA